MNDVILLDKLVSVKNEHILPVCCIQVNDYGMKDTTLPISNLRDTQEYEFRVFAKNKAGKSAPSRTLLGVEPKANISKIT